MNWINSLPVAIEPLATSSKTDIYLWQRAPLEKNFSLEIPKHARVYHLKSSHPESAQTHKNTFKVKLQEHAHYTYFEINRGDIAQESLEVSLEGEQSRAELYGLFDLSQSQKVTARWELRHQVPHTSSEQYVKALMRDESTFDFCGKICIAPKAQKTDAVQLNKNLLLSKRAKALSRPELEIFADDVKCGHGLTTSQFSEEELFYLQARAIPAKRAKELLAQAFVDDLLQKLPTLLQDKLRSLNLGYSL